ncbi:hypothetical protein BHQ23_30060 [Mycobacterium gordonae]|uniref:Uncharacterized protein n=1 Tax=Mycobacterium gordonae TaxID=1778 RepID=A0A1X1VYI0_MYCGO|nr:hypothetical protein BHQ23_30060 [Mycobacterium gordonae]ORV75015.1 hypothetical protein AWC08_00740 [Mycobacterium gordonae]
MLNANNCWQERRNSLSCNNTGVLQSISHPTVGFLERMEAYVQFGHGYLFEDGLYLSNKHGPQMQDRPAHLRIPLGHMVTFPNVPALDAIEERFHSGGA